MIVEPEISLNYALSYREFAAGHKLAARRNSFLFVIHLVGRFVAPIAAALAALMCLINFFNGHRSLITPIMPLIFWLVFLSCILPISWRYSYKQLKLSPRQDPQMTFQADKTSFSRQIRGMGDITWLWSATHSIADNRLVALISVRKGAFLFIPRRVISDDELLRLKEFLRMSKQK